MIGIRLGGYTLTERLGAGAMGTVYLAVRGDERVAIKVLHPHLLEEGGHFKRFVQETVVGRRLSHPNVVRTLDGDMNVVDGEPRYFLVMEFVEGRTVGSLLQETGPFPEALVFEIARQVALGLEAVHEQGIVHRDLKPDNILITDDEMVKLMDLGVAHIDDGGLRFSTTGKFVGTIPYAAPEQFRGDSSILDGRTDLFSLGVVLYEITAGVHPFGCDDVAGIIHGILHRSPSRLSSVRSGVTPLLETTVHRLLAREPSHRFESASQLLAALGAEGHPGGTPSPILEAEPLLRRRPTLSRETEVYGRQHEFERLDALFDAVKKREGRVVLLEGKVGLGKTRLVDEFVERRRQAGEEMEFLFGVYPPGGAAAGLEAFTRSFNDRLQDEGLDVALARLLADTPTLVAPFAATLRGEPSLLGRDSLHTAFSRVLQGLAAERPLVLLVDDLHFAPEDGRSLFASLACAVPEHPILLIGTARSRPSGSWHEDLDRLEHVETLSLDPLGPDDIEGLLGEAIGVGTVVRRLGERIAEESRGNPFFLFEILKDLKERKVLEPREDGTWAARGRPEDVSVPATVRLIVTSRLAELEETDRDLLEVAACLGFEFDPLVVAEALGMTRIRALQQLTQAQRRHGLIRAVGRRFAFDHHEIQEVLYNGITPMLREEYHQLLADTLEGSAGVAPEKIAGALAADICEHRLRGARAAGALPYLEAALEHLRSVYHHERAVGIATRLLETDGLLEGEERVDLLLSLSDLLETGARYERMREVLNEARDGADAAGDDVLRARVRSIAGRLANKLGEGEAAKAVLEKAIQIARDAGDPDIETSAWTELGNVHAEAGRADRAEECYERGLDLARSAENRKAEANAIGNLGLLAWERGDLDVARERCEMSCAAFREIGERRGEASMLGMLGLLLDDLGEPEKAAELHRQHLDTCREIGYRRGEGIATVNLGDSLRRLGHWEEARRHMERSREISVETGDRAGVASALTNIGAIQKDLGLSAAAADVYRQALETSRSIGSKRVEGISLLNLATLEDRAGDSARGLRTAEESLELFEEIGYSHGVAWAEMTLGRIELERGEEESARRRLKRAADIGTEIGYPDPRLLGAVYLAVLGEDPAGAEEALRAEAGKLAHPQRIEAWFTLWRATGNPEHLELSLEALESLEECISEGQRGHLREGVPLYGQILAASARAAEEG